MSRYGYLDVEVRISRSMSDSPLDLEITRVSCISFFTLNYRIILNLCCFLIILFEGSEDLIHETPTKQRVACSSIPLKIT